MLKLTSFLLLSVVLFFKGNKPSTLSKSAVFSIFLILSLTSCNSKEKAKYYFERGIEFKEANNFTDAILDFDKAIEVYSNYHEAYYEKGLINMEFSEYSEALRNFDKAIDINSNIFEYKSKQAYCTGYVGAKNSTLEERIKHTEEFLKKYENE